MSQAAEYRQKAAHHRHQIAETVSLKESGRHRKTAEAYEALARSEDWLDGVVSPQSGTVTRSADSKP
jgi:hypothetical protein